MKIFICDGSVVGFFTAVFDAYKEKDCLITADSDVQLTLDSELVRVTADGEKSRRVINKINSIDGEAVDDICLVLRSCDPLKENAAFEYIRQMIARQMPIKKAMSLPEVVEFNDLIYKVTGEIHRLKGLIRFMESANGALYAPYSPDNDITDLLMPHFAERLKNQRFVIHDVRRKVAGMYNGVEWIMTETGEASVYLSEYERAFETLWKKYYDTVNIPERKHEKQMKGSMPVRYWKFLPEKRDS